MQKQAHVLPTSLALNAEKGVDTAETPASLADCSRLRRACHFPLLRSGISNTSTVAISSSGAGEGHSHGQGVFSARDGHLC